MEIIPSATPEIMGAENAAAAGMVGVHFIPLSDGSIQPLVWCSPLPAYFQHRLVSFSNMFGDINNSGLELAASVEHNDVLAQLFDVRGRHPRLAKQCGNNMTAEER
jgi:hypothetical protein